MVLTLAELHSHDPQSRGDRFLCPSDECRDKREGHHRSLRLDHDSGKFMCHRCHFKGILDDFKVQRPRYRPTVSGVFGARPSQEYRRAEIPEWITKMQKTLPDQMMSRQIEKLRDIADELRLGITSPGRDHGSEVLSAAVLIEDIWLNDR